VRYGGNTSCVEVQTDDGTLIILDCGTGARKLGVELARTGANQAHILIGHTHTDHIQGLPFFVPAFPPGSHVTIYGPPGIDRSFPRAVTGLMEYAYFPVPITDLPAELDFQELGEEKFAVGGVTVQTLYLNHTAPCLGYRIETGGVALAYATDHEPHSETLWRSDRARRDYSPGAMLHASDARHAEFLHDADLVVHDAQYLASEYSQKVRWGHSTVEYAVDVAIAAGAKRLALFHHDPSRTDKAVDRVLADATERGSAAGSSIEILAAAEGMELLLLEHGRSRVTDRGPLSPLMPTRPRILVAEDDDGVAETLKSILEDDGYEVRRTKDGLQTLELISQMPFDLLLLDLEMPGMNGFDVCRAVRSNKRLDPLPILMLTVRSDPSDIVAGFDAGVTDYMTKPFSEAQLRARARSWLTRSSR
jgi:CheY-like chemotaxis protein/phosphoribosyl 1,2-cyclic phosphodiesterase